MTEEERRKFEQWKKSFGSEEGLSARVYYYLTDPYWWDGPQQERFIKKGASESQIMEYYEYFREKEARKESDRIWAERKAREEADLARLEYTAQRFDVVSGRDPEPTAEQVAINRRAGEVFYRDLLSRSDRG